MNKLFQLTVTSLLVSGISLSMPVFADTVTSEENKPLLKEDKSYADNTAKKTPVPVSSEDVLQLSLQHRFNGGKPVTETIEIPFDKLDNNPLVLLEVLKENFSKHLEKQKKPVTIDTEIGLLLPAEAIQVLGELPKMSIKTLIESNGGGKSNLVLPAYRREVPKKFDGGGLIDWKGLTAQFTFTEAFETLTAALKTAGFQIQAPDNFTASLGEVTFTGAFDANLTPTQVVLNLSSFNMRQSNEEQLNLQALVVQFDTNKSSKGLELGNAMIKVGRFDFTEEGSNISLDNFRMSSSSTEQDSLVNLTLETQFNQLELPKELQFDISSFVVNLAVNRLNANALLALQATARELKGTEDPMILMTVFGKFMEVIPQLMATSPEIALNQLLTNTTKGNLQGNLKISLDGKKATSLEEMPTLISALSANTEFVISKQLLTYVLTTYMSYEMQQQAAMFSSEELNKEALKQIQQQAKEASEQQIQSLVAIMLLVEEGDNYKLAVDFKNSELTVNGQKMPLPFGSAEDAGEMPPAK